jgi:hypothetical protein
MSVGIAVSVDVSVTAVVAVEVLVGVSVGTSVEVGDEPPVDVSVTAVVAVDVLVGVSVGTSVKVGDEPPSVVIINCGGLVPSRLEKLVAVLLVVSIMKLYWPVPLTAFVTSTSVQLLEIIAPELPMPFPKAGALLKFMVVSSHPAVVVCTV